ncbi:hypothetical protein N7478_010267 [Penicillium angulare]|uniref:uncharacterized protein n=1 Tax=Penicillium angulare TaxID=116970 RepID=UPI002542595C|nr:uncharacterized protein N7478_010267 [Penicillium angulare]KAJ5267459.1 hypothetical protein N7478_010267 [Penicillium angulare]
MVVLFLPSSSLFSEYGEPSNGLFEQRTSAHGGIFLPGQDYTPLTFQVPISPRAEDSLSEHTVDPAILEGCRLPPAEKNTIGAASGCATFRPRSSKVNKPSVVIDTRSRKRSARLPRGANGKKASFSTILAHFSALTAEDRMQFLSWLFEGALSQCLISPPSLTTTSSRAASRARAVSCTDSSSDSEDSPVYLHSSRKDLTWSEEEDRLLVKLKEQEKLTWPEEIGRFGQVFPGRSSGSIKVHWSTKVSKRY